MDFNKLWANFLDTLQNHYMDFNGRVGRPQFWYYILVVVGVSIVASVVGSVTTRLISSLVSLALFLPNLGMTIRRFHDVGKPTSWVLILMIPLVAVIVLSILTVFSLLLGPLFLIFAGLTTIASLLALAATVVIIYFCAQPGVAGPNEFGPAPPEFAPN
jgi:uncharacterized membrane protein YhaH (DUF805 family)